MTVSKMDERRPKAKVSKMKVDLDLDKIKAVRELEQSATDALTELFRKAPRWKDDSEAVELGFSMDELHDKLSEVLDARLGYYKQGLEENRTTWKLLKQKRMMKRLNCSMKPIDVARGQLLAERQTHTTEIRNNMMFAIMLGLVNGLAGKLGDTESFRDAMRVLTPVIAHYRDELEKEQKQQEQEKSRQGEWAKLYSKRRTITS